MFDPQSIPGMIETVEQEMLTELAAQPSVAETGLIVEFGTFFGRSTSCLANGAATWWTPDRGAPAIRAYDVFRCIADQGIGLYVVEMARRAGIEALLREDGGQVDFQPVFRHYLKPAEERGLLTSTAADMSQARHDGAPIGLLHLDAPKDYADLRYILHRFFPSLSPGGYVVWQDYFYQWSATLIAGAEVLAQAGIMEFERSAASSAISKVLRTPTADEIVELDLMMQATPTERLLDQAIDRIKRMAIGRPDSLDRPAEFASRLYLAKMQYLWKARRYAEADQALGELFAANGGNVTGAVLGKLRELLREGFGAG